MHSHHRSHNQRLHRLNLPSGNRPLDGFEPLHVASGERVLGVDVGREDFGEDAEVFCIEGEAVAGEDILDGEVIGWSGHG